MRKVTLLTVLIAAIFAPSLLWAQELHQDLEGIWRAKVLEVVSQEERVIPGTDTASTYQTIDGEKKGEIITIYNDYLVLEKGDRFFLFYTIDVVGKEMYAVRDIDRRASIAIFVGIFVFFILLFGGRQGLRSLLSLAGSLFVILYVLVPSLLEGYPPVLTSIIVASIILFVAIYFTHGFNRESSAAF